MYVSFIISIINYLIIIIIALSCHYYIGYFCCISHVLISI